MAVTTPAAPRGKPDLNPRTDPLSPWWHIDPVVILVALALSAFGVVVVYSATRGIDPEDYDVSFLQRQIAFVAVGVVVMAIVATIDYNLLRKLWPVAYVASVVLLLAVLSPLGTVSNGARSWFQFGTFQVQPSEFGKVVLIVTLAAYVSRYGDQLRFRNLLIALGLAGVPMLLILRQPDLGTVLVYTAIVMGMLLVGGVRLRHVLLFSLTGVLMVAYVLNSGQLEEYQVERLTEFIVADEDDSTGGAAYQQQQAEIAVGNGGIEGRGFGEGQQTKSGLVPEQQTDFIFTVVGEELGFVRGSAPLLALFAVLTFRIWRTASIARDKFGRLICAGVLTMLVFQMFQSVGMTVGLMPITGIPLPFVSYGGSSILTQFIALGLVLNVHMHRYRLVKD